MESNIEHSKEDLRKQVLSRKEQLTNDLEYLNNVQRKYELRSKRFPIIGLILLVGAVLLIVFAPRGWVGIVVGFIVGFYGLILVSSPSIAPREATETRIREVQNELDLLDISDQSPQELRAEKLFKRHQFELKKYYDQTLKHSGWIFAVGIVCILLGFAIIGFTIYLVATSSILTTIPEKVISAILGGVCGIMTNYIAVIYLKVYSETVKALTEFHDRLVLTHHLHFANFLLAKVKEGELKEKSLAEMALTLSRRQP